MSTKTSRSKKTRKSTEVTPLEVAQDCRQPLVYAARGNFHALARVAGLSNYVQSRTEQARSLPQPARCLAKWDKLAGCFEDWENQDEQEKQRAVLNALKLLDSLQTCLSKSGQETDRDFEATRKQILLDQSVQIIKGIGGRAAEALAARQIVTIGDLLRFFPTRYEDRSQVAKIAEAVPGEFCRASGKIVGMDNRPGRWGKKRPYSILVEDSSGSCLLTWFHYGAQSIPRRFQVGDEVIFSGKISWYRDRKQIVHPDIETAADSTNQEATIHGEPSDGLAAVVPVYPDIAGIPSRLLRMRMAQIAEEFTPLVDDYLPDKLRKSLGFSPLSDTLLQIHRPPENADVREWNRKRGAVHKRLIFDDFFALQLVLAQRRKNVKTQAGIQMERLNGLATRFYRNFKYKLTGDQKQALLDIVEDLCGTSPMSRMLQGDVGSGKTVVAILSALLVVENGYQVALMAPTEILAEQHYRNLLKHLPEGIEAVLLTGGKKEKEKQAIKKRIKHGDSAIVVGTHALIQQSVDFHKLAYVIIDEQHRFGVRQRSALVQKGVHPHSLVMTATPIPRSLSMTLYGDLDLSIIREKPAGRSPVRTHIVEEEQRPAMWRAVHRELERDGQAYIVLPLIEESEKLELKNALEEYDRHRKRFQNYPVGLLHGRMKSEEKDQVMAEFQKGTTRLLVATTVIEVGVDVPNATVMVIENAERFGLAQLHQLRGRIGRGTKASTCFLCHGDDAAGRERLETLVSSEDGFLIAEKDMELRGPGDVTGTRQWGNHGFGLANLARDQDLLLLAKNTAFRLTELDPDLEKPEHRRLKQLFERTQEKIGNVLTIG